MSPFIIHDFFCNREKETSELEKDTVIGTDGDNSEEPAPVNNSMNETEKKLLNSAKILERMLNLNTYEEVARDFRFYEDPSDEYKAPEGSLLPLWKFKFAKEPGLEVTYLLWSPSYDDLFGVSLGTT